jgi:hypothetical protein
MHMSSSSRTAAAAVALAVPVALELAWPPFGDHAWGLEIFAVSQVAGWSLLLSVCRRSTAPLTRAARVGRRCVLVGCGLQLAFAAVFAVTATDGEPLEAAFGLFLLGFLALFLGGATWGIHHARAGARLAGVGLVSTGVLGLLAVLVGLDPWHDAFLLSSYAAWVLVGRGLDELTPFEVARSDRAARAGQSRQGARVDLR